jgi:hypothetical protein
MAVIVQCRLNVTSQCSISMKKHLLRVVDRVKQQKLPVMVPTGRLVRGAFALFLVSVLENLVVFASHWDRDAEPRVAMVRVD